VIANTFSSLALFGDIGGGELLVVFIAILLLFGGKRLPSIARSLGKASQDLRRASQDFKDQLMRADAEEPRPAPDSGKGNQPPVASPLPPPAPEGNRSMPPANAKKDPPARDTAG
jgi:sec-independent protein translocase protein TatA